MFLLDPTGKLIPQTGAGPDYPEETRTGPVLPFLETALSRPRDFRRVD
jgi:hypothetical protein